MSNRDRHPRSEVAAVRLLAKLLKSRPGRQSSRRLTAEIRDDLDRALHWGWGTNIVGIFVGKKRTGSESIDGRLCLSFHVVRKVPKRRIPRRMRIPQEMRFESLGLTLTTDIIEIGVPRLHALGVGAKVGHFLQGSGTLGLIVKKTSGNQLLGLSCSHVLARYGAANEGDIIESPPDLNSDVIQNPVGVLTDDFSILHPDIDSPTDAALFRPNQQPNMEIEGIGVPSGVSNFTAEDFNAGQIRTIRNGVGSGLRTGEVIGAKGSILLEAVGAPLGRVALSDQVAYDTRSHAGDSGAAVFLRGTTQVLGMHVGGEEEADIGYFTPIRSIFRTFDLTLPAI
jgi:hypothetical protein